MNIDYLIVGQGIAGTLLSYELLLAGKKVLVIDAADPHKSSLVAGAVINPMAGKHWTPSKEAALFIPQAIETYRRLEHLLGIPILKATELHVFHETEAAEIAFADKSWAFPEYFSTKASGDVEGSYFNAPFGQGTIKGLWLVDAFAVLEGWRKYLVQQQAYRKEVFDMAALQLSEQGVAYQDIRAERIVFCEGATAAQNPFFNKLPFTQNRGEALLLHIPGLSQEHIYHRRLRLVPKGEGVFWCGSNYIWNAADLLPDNPWQQDALQEIHAWLKIPFSVIDHIVARRPTTAGQVPLLGLHPQYQAAGIFNGLGTRGFSAGPYWARAMSAMLTGETDDIPGYDVVWFRKYF